MTVNGLVPCPVPSCDYRAQAENGIWRHLMADHVKSDVVRALIDQGKNRQILKALSARRELVQSRGEFR
jgi:hypothetical protein